ncbi:MAG: DUF835 domain-containing protein [Candidatus Thermoplasmatota archaeon]|nr:DUF835 domain-containing protein [Candidatus Thermoplasmatota archaeon]
MKVCVKPGCSYILKEKSLRKYTQPFKKLFSKGFRALCITNRKPEELKKKYELSIEVFRLNDKNSKKPAEIIDRIEKFSQSTKKGIVLFEGIDKIIKNNDFLNTLTVLESINDTIMSSNSSLILAVDTSKFNKKELAFLERNLEPILAL